VIFLLLIFFVLTAQFRREEQFLPIRLPGSTSSVERFDIVDPLRITIAVKADQCLVDLGRNRLVTIPTDPGTSDLQGLIQSFVQVLEQDKRNPKDPVEISCDDAVSWELLVKVYNSLYSVGLEDVTFTLE
jgi:biopolymer transport protein ExbD